MLFLTWQALCLQKQNFMAEFLFPAISPSHSTNYTLSQTAAHSSQPVRVMAPINRHEPTSTSDLPKMHNTPTHTKSVYSPSPSA
jgi:hypothetical protein